MNTIKNLVDTLYKYYKDDFSNVTKEIFEERLNMCNNCEHFKIGFCRICNCNMYLKAHIRVAECPINKWGINNSSGIYSEFSQTGQAGKCCGG